MACKHASDGQSPFDLGKDSRRQADGMALSRKALQAGGTGGGVTKPSCRSAGKLEWPLARPYDVQALSRVFREMAGPTADQHRWPCELQKSGIRQQTHLGAFWPVDRLGNYFLACVRRSPLGVRQSGPLGHSRRSIKCRPIRRDLISGSILGCAGVPSTAARAVNSVLLRALSFAIRGRWPCPSEES